jgi:rubrerythrin
MIKGRIKKTDTYTIETKMMFRPRRRRFGAREMYSVETWFFLPVDMGINKRNYTKIDFYRELKTYIKIDPPKVLLAEIANKEGEFMQSLKDAFSNFDPNDPATLDNLNDLILIFMNIMKKAVKREVRKIEIYKSGAEKQRVAGRLIKNLDIAIDDFRNSAGDIDAFKTERIANTFKYSDEYISNLKYRYIQHVIFLLNKEKEKDTGLIQNLKTSLKKEIGHRKRFGFPIASQSNKDNDKLLRRWDVVKYYVTNKLILNTKVDKEIKYIMEVLYSIAAGIAMIFATAVAFYYGKKYGNFTYGLFVVLVISYMFKDRIKEWGRNFFNTILKKQMLDHRFNLYDNNGKKIGISNTGFNFIAKRDLPKEIYNIRYNINDEQIKTNEKIMKFTRKVKIHSKRMRNTFKSTKLRGINDVLKFNFLPLTLRLEDPDVPIYLHNDDMDVKRINTQKTVPVNMILAIKYRNETIYHRYRLLINRNGIRKLKTIEI